MGTPSIFNQVKAALETLVLDEKGQKAYKDSHAVDSIKKALRVKGKPNRSLPVILSKRTFSNYLETCTTFFERARKLTGKKMLAKLFTVNIIVATLDAHYQDKSPATLRSLLSALNMLHQGMRRRRWVKGNSPINAQLRQHVRGYRDDGSVRAPRFGYLPEDAPRIIDHLKSRNSVFALPAEIVLRCGLRLSEVAGLKGSDIDLETLQLRVKGKGGKVRFVALPADLAGRLNPSEEFLFTPSQSWKSAFYQAVRNAARELDIKVSGLHRLRSNYAQENYLELRKQGKSDQVARQEVSHSLGHNRIDVVGSYIPKG